MSRVVTIVFLLIVASFEAYCGCPVSDFDKVIPFCTEDNEFGIVYPAGVSNEGIDFFNTYDEDG